MTSKFQYRVIGVGLLGYFHMEFLMSGSFSRGGRFLQREILPLSAWRRGIGLGENFPEAQWEKVT